MTVEPLTPERWHDLETLFGKNGACAGCWCMWFRLKQRDFLKGKGAGNRRALKRILDSGEVPGLLAYHGPTPVGWVSIAPRERFVRLAGSRVLAPVDERPVWSIVCLFVARAHRRKGVMDRLVAAAAEYARSRGAATAEGYPLEPDKRMADAFAYHGIVSSFRKAGFQEVLRRSEKRPIMRKELKGTAPVQGAL